MKVVYKKSVKDEMDSKITDAIEHGLEIDEFILTHHEGRQLLFVAGDQMTYRGIKVTVETTAD